MKNILYSLLILAFFSCSTKTNNDLKTAPLEVKISEHNISIKLDNKGIIEQNGVTIGKIEGNKIIDSDNNNTFTLTENFILLDAKKDTIADYSNKNIFVNDVFLGVLKWNTKGSLIADDGTELGIQITPNDTTLYRTASVVLEFAQKMKKDL